MGVMIGVAADMSPREFNKALSIINCSSRGGKLSYGQEPRSAMEYSRKQHPTAKLFHRRIMDR